MKWQFWVKLLLQAAGHFLGKCVLALLLLYILWSEGWLYWPPDLWNGSLTGLFVYLLFAKKRTTQHADETASSE